MSRAAFIAWELSQHIEEHQNRGKPFPMIYISPEASKRAYDDRRLAFVTRYDADHPVIYLKQLIVIVRDITDKIDDHLDYAVECQDRFREEDARKRYPCPLCPSPQPRNIPLIKIPQ